MAWRMFYPNANNSVSLVAPAGSRVMKAQRDLEMALKRTLEAVAEDVRAGLSETAGVNATLAEGDRTSVIVKLPALPIDCTPGFIAWAIDCENVEAWCDESRRVHVAVSPWYTTKDVDQTVLSITKVIHVLTRRARDRRNPYG